MINSKSLLFTSSSITMSLFVMITNIISIIWITPDFMGIWNAYFIFVTYIYFLQLGTINGLSRELPFYLGKKKQNIAIALAKTSLFIVKIVSVLVFILGLLYITFLSYKKFNNYIFYTSVSILFLMILQFYNNYLLSTYRSNDSFKKLSFIYLYMTIIIIFSILLVKYYNYYGHIIRLPLIALIQVLLLHIYRPLKIKSKFKKLYFKILIGTGLPLFLFNYFTLIANTFNRLIILKFGTTLQLGFYTPAIAVNSAMKLIPITLYQYVYPKLSFMVGENNSNKILWSKTKKISILIFCLLLVIAILGYFIVDIFIKTFFPEYLKGLFAAKMALVSGIFSGMSLPYTSSLNIIKAFKYIGLLSLSRVFIFYFVLYIFASNMNVLDGVAYGLVCCELFYLIFAYFLNYNYFKKNEINKNF